MRDTLAAPANQVCARFWSYDGHPEVIDLFSWINTYKALVLSGLATFWVVGKPIVILE
jgi:hypothetical protein